jgi:hypothetical protein
VDNPVHKPWTIPWGETGERNGLWDWDGMQNVPIHIDYKGRELSGVADPVVSSEQDQVPRAHVVYLDGKFFGTIRCEKKGWVIDRPADLDLVQTIGEYLHAWYE